MTSKEMCLPALMLAIGTLLAAPDVRQWKQASPDYPLSVPRDHVNHPAYKLEWWYYTGNVDTDRGRRFGYQLTFFRVGVDPVPANPSTFAVRDLFVAHAAVTDVSGRQHLFAERVSRGAAGSAGAALFDYRVWNDDWEARLEYGQHRLQARDPRFAIDLLLAEDRPAVLNGVRGYSQKGSTPGNASEYYSLPRMPTEGAIMVAGERYQVRGLSWMDHEFGTTFLEKSQQGWDWFSLQLDDGTSVMVFELRGTDGSIDPQSSGTLVPADGAARHLAAGDFALEPGRVWTSAASGGRYPVEWHVRLPADGLDLSVTPVLDGQEIVGGRTGVSYWEGAIDVHGTRSGRPIAGRGYLEMTGYAGGAMGQLLR
jgi:predicted secreted hydrolase